MKVTETNQVETNEIEREQFFIPEHRMLELEARLAKLAKIAAKVGVAAPTVKQIGEEFRTFVWTTSDTGPGYWLSTSTAATELQKRGLRHRIERFVEVEFTGELPKLAGWKFLAKLEHTEAGTMIQKLSQEPVPEEYRQAQPGCEHCGKARKRRDTYVVSSESGEYRQVGRSCLKDFTGHQSPEQIAAICMYLERLSSVAEFNEELLEDGFRSPASYSLEAVLNFTASVVREFGYVSRKDAEFDNKTATASRVMSCLENPEAAKKMAPEQQDTERAANVLAWAKGIVAAPDDDYLWNLSVIAENGIVARKRVGLAASMILAHQRATETEAIRKTVKETQKESEFFGEVKKRYELTLKILSMREFAGNFGAMYLYKFVTPEGNSAAWWASHYFPVVDGSRVIGVGDTVRVKATVKSHEDYKGRDGVFTRQTNLTRVTLLSLVEAAAEAA